MIVGEDFITEVQKFDISCQEKFEMMIKIFSKYLAATNTEYLYNETYLTEMCTEFFKFHRYLRKKQDIIVGIKTKIEEFSKINSLDIIFVVDQCWEIGGENNKVLYPINRDKICRDEIEVKGILKKDAYEEGFLKKYKVEYNNSVKRIIEKISADLESRIEGWDNESNKSEKDNKY